MEKNIIKNKKPYISVIIPVYNVEKYLKKCLDMEKYGIYIRR